MEHEPRRASPRPPSPPIADADLVRFLLYHQRRSTAEAHLALAAWRSVAEADGLDHDAAYRVRAIAWLREHYPER